MSSKMENEEPKSEEISSIQTLDKEPLVPNEIVKIKKLPVTVEPIVFGIFLADCLEQTITINLIESRTCEIHFGFNKSICGALGSKKENESDIEAVVQPYSAVIITSMMFLSVFLPAVMSLFFGSWSDYNGRKLVLILPSIGYFLKFIFLGIFSCFPKLSPMWVLLCVLPVALSGGMVNFIFATYTYISDITQEDKRSIRISIVESLMTAGCVIGLLCAGPVYEASGDYGYIGVYASGACVILLVTIPTCLFLPDSIQREESGKGIMHVFEAKHLKEMLEVCFKKRDECRRAVMFLIIISLTITISAMTGEGNILYLFVKLKFGWNIQEYTIWTSITLAIGFVGVFLGILLLIKCIKIPDPIICVIAYALKCISALYLAFLPQNKPVLMYFVGAINIFGGLCGPVSRTILSKTVPKEDLGKVFAFLSSSEAIFPLGIGPLYTIIYNATIRILPNAFLLFSSFLFFICCLFFIIIYFIYTPIDQRKYNQLKNETE